MRRFIGIAALLLCVSACERMDFVKQDGTPVTLVCPSGSELEIEDSHYPMGSFEQYPKYQVAQCRSDWGHRVGTGYGFVQEPDGTRRILLSATFDGFHVKEVTYNVMPKRDFENRHDLDRTGLTPLCGGRFHHEGGVYGAPRSRYEVPCESGRTYMFPCEHGVYTRHMPELAYPGIVELVQCMDAEGKNVGEHRFMTQDPYPQWRDVTDEALGVERSDRDGFNRQIAAWPGTLQQEAHRIRFALKDTQYQAVGLCSGRAISEEIELQQQFGTMFADGRVPEQSEGLLLVQLAHRLADARKRDSDACVHRITRH